MSRKITDFIIDCLCIVMIFAAANCRFIYAEYHIPVFILILMFIAANVLPLFSLGRFPGKTLRIANHGVRCLKIFLVSSIASICINLYLIILSYFSDWKSLLAAILICIAAEAAIFWNGMLCVYFTSLQLGVKTRILGAVFGMVPVIHLYFLGKIIKTVSEEVDFETKKYMLNLSRKEQQICKTKYPILMVHGVFFRDSEYLNYWGRIPKELIANGAEIYYGEHQSAASVPDSAAELAARIKKIITETGCGKLNIIAHSKGGLDCRYAIEHYGIGEYVAS
ncbi:MAG: esterase/lipase family protein, partial [Lachnospiraceae bacterium]